MRTWKGVKIAKKEKLLPALTEAQVLALGLADLPLDVLHKAIQLVVYVTLKGPNRTTCPT